MYKSDFIFEKIKDKIYHMPNIDFFSGQLGISVGLLNYGSHNNIESIYDVGLQTFNFCFDKLQSRDYLNYDIDVSLVGYLFEFFRHNDIMEADTDTILKDLDDYISSLCSNTRYELGTEYNTIMYCYYLASRYKEKAITASNFMKAQILILKLIEMSCEVNRIEDLKSLCNRDISSAFNIFLFLKYLISINSYQGLAKTISDRIVSLLAKRTNSSCDYYHRSLMCYMKKDFSEITNILLEYDNISILLRKYKLNRIQLFTLIGLLKSSLISTVDVWKENKEIVRQLFLTDKFWGSTIPNLSLIDGLSAHYWIEMDFGTVEFVNLFPYCRFNSTFSF